MASKEYIAKLKEAEGVGKVTATLVAKRYKTEEDLVEALQGPGPIHDDVQEHRNALAKVFLPKAKKVPKRVDVRCDAIAVVQVKTNTGIYIFRPGAVLNIPASVTKTVAFKDLERRLQLTVLG